MNRKKIALVCLIAIVVSACAGNARGGTKKEAPKQAMEDANAQADGTEKGAAEGKDGSDAPGAEQAGGETQGSQGDDTAQADGDPEAPGSGSYEVDGINVTYYASVRNDKTGNWRLAVIADGSDLNGYVVDFYNKFVTDSSEVFGIVNLGLRTVTRVSYVMDGWLDVSVMEYRDGEEHDASMLYGGGTLMHYWINSETGEINEELE